MMEVISQMRKKMHQYLLRGGEDGAILVKTDILVADFKKLLLSQGVYPSC